MSQNDRNSLIFDSRNEADTDGLGARIAAAVATGLVIELNGQLGSGKTRLVRAICIALGIDPVQVNSPTFVLLQLYTDGRIPVAHFDTYRLGHIDEFMAIGAEEFTNSGNWLCLIEWGERVAECLPDDRLRIGISSTSTEGRRFTLTGFGSVSSELLDRIRDASGRNGG